MTIGVDLGGTNIRAGIRKGDEIIERVESQLKDKDSLERTLVQLIHLIKPLISGSIKGIGVAVPSVVDVENGIVYDVVNIPSWKRVPLKSILEREFQIIVEVQNDANCFAWGEHRHGLAKAHRQALGITLGTGVGAGVIIGGEIYNGRNAGAGEVGYLNYLDRDFEFYAGSMFFVEKHHTSAREAAEQAQQGSARALAIWHDYGKHIGQLVKSVVYAFDPEMIVFGGSIAKAWDYFEPAMHESISSGFHFPKSMEALEITHSQNDNITLLGASALIKD